MSGEDQGTNLFELAGQSELQVHRASLASLEAERARLVAKYDARIEALKGRITELEAEAGPAGPDVEARPVRVRARRHEKAPGG